MKTPLVSLIVFVLLFGLTATGLSAEGQKRRDRKKEEPVCWQDEAELQNPNFGKHTPSRLPPALADARVERSVILLKLCVSEMGMVTRVLVLRSSGNVDIDGYYTSELAKWTFTPLERRKQKVRSVVPVAVTLHIK